MNRIDEPGEKKVFHVKFDQVLYITTKFYTVIWNKKWDLDSFIPSLFYSYINCVH